MHPIVAQLSPSSEQRPAIAARGVDVLLTAGAGTGKTRTLVARYLAALADGLPMRSLVAITFTKKAAREMRSRVRQEIRRALAAGLVADEHRRWRECYTQLDAARIGTIHSLCAEILRSHPAEAAIDPRFDVLDEGLGNLLRRQARDEALVWGAGQAAAQGCFALLGERGLARALDVLLGQRLEAEAAFAALPDDVLAHWQRLLDQHRRQRLRQLTNDPQWATAWHVLGSSAATDPNDLLEIQRQAALAAAAAALRAADLAAEVQAWQALTEIRLTGGRKAAWPGGKAEVDEVKAALCTTRVGWKEAAQALSWALGPADEVRAAALPGLAALFCQAARSYHRLKEERNALDFDDLESGALALLRDCPPVRQRWQEEVQAVLVDEFQDTNARQRDLVRWLDGGRGILFLVGDAKQSIYRFRGADVSVFRQERERVAQAGGQNLAMGTSYRAHAGLIEGLNDLLRPILGEEADAQRPWAEPFAPLHPQRQAASQGFAAPHVELHLAVGSKGEGALERAADALAARLAAWVASGAIRVGSGSTARPLAYGDVAILCRSGASFPTYEDALERTGVPFLTVAGRGFYDRPEIRDLLNALQALADPTDDLALVGLLRSPALALSDADVFRLWDAHQQAGVARPFWAFLQQAAEQAGTEASLRRAVALIGGLQSQAGRVAVGDLLK
ncbi:MAG: UvrD-helicase domain-containing protein, partial [Chloroflexi bacterium]|nr:UvrD-helicase domain-containing protein [Chloroflexota bacterium]